VRLSGMHVDGFSEGYATGDGFMRRMDARAKLVLTAACIVASIASPGMAAPLSIGTLCIILLLVARAPMRVVIMRGAGPLLFGIAAAVLQALSHQGVHSGLHILARVYGSVSSVLFLTMTTPAYRLLSAAARLKMPQALCEVSLFAYRYVFVLLEDAVTVYHAQCIRLGYVGTVRGLKSLGTLAGSVFLRAYSQAEATGEAMALRGYTGDYLPACREKFRAVDAAFLCVGASLCLAVSLWT
jgi:cobalt/nickel transport system permease protein